jgi:predicted RecA/RadA family phage recombinase
MCGALENDMQSQASFTDKLVVAAAPVGGYTGGKPTQVGDLVGFPFGTVAEGERSTLLVRGIHGTNQVLEDEVWTEGQPLYWHELAQVFTAMETEWPAGWAAEAKAANTLYGYVALDRPLRRSGLIIAPFDVSLMAASVFTLGNKTLRDFGAGSRLITKVEFFELTAMSSGGAATLSLGDGTGSNDQIFAATAFNNAVFDAYHDFTPDDGGTPPEPDVSLSQVVLGLAGALLTAGKFILRIEYAPA